MVVRMIVVRARGTAGALQIRRGLAQQLAWLGLSMSMSCTDPVFLTDAAASGGDASIGTQEDAALDASGAEEDAAVDASGGSLMDAAVDASGGSLMDAAVDASGGSLMDAAVDASGGGPMDAAVDASGGGLMDASGDAQQDGALADAAPDAQGDAGERSIKLNIAKDQDDCLWVVRSVALEESLHFTKTVDGLLQYSLEVSTDDEENRAGLRFQLPLTRGTRIVSANLTLKRVYSLHVSPGSTMRVQVFDSDNCPVFDPSHAHQGPQDHVPEGLWAGQAIGGFDVGLSQGLTTSPDLSVLVQHVLDRPGFGANAYIGFLLTPEQMPANEWAEFADFEQGFPATLELAYQPQ
jgi:hypothetical protein